MAIGRKKITGNFLEITAPMELVQKRISESAREISRVNEAMGLGLAIIKHDGVYRTFGNGESILIKKGNFRRKKLTSQRFKVR